MKISNTLLFFITDGTNQAKLTFQPISKNFANEKSELIVNSGQNPSLKGDPNFVATDYLQDVLVKCFQAHSLGDFCIFGEKGVGKTALIDHFASLLGFQVFFNELILH